MSKPQTAPATPWWKNKKIIIRIAIAVVLVVIVFISAAYTFHWDLAGLIGSQKKTVTTEIIRSPQEKVTIAEEGKTLWDWLQLLGVLAIPIVVGFGTAFFTRQQAKTSEANAENQQQEELLRTFFDKISELLLDEKLDSNPKIQSIVRARTLAVLRILNTERKEIVLRFLHDSDLLQYVKSFLYLLDLSHISLNRIDLTGANLNGTDLRGTDLTGAKLRKASLRGTDLRGADLRLADLRGADLSEANLNEAHLWKANLNGTDLRGTDLTGAFLFGAFLFGADLTGASITPKQVEEIKDAALEQLAQNKPSKPAAPQEATTEQPSTTPAQAEIKPEQTSQEEAEQQEHIPPKQDTDAAH